MKKIQKLNVRSALSGKVWLFIGLLAIVAFGHLTAAAQKGRSVTQLLDELKIEYSFEDGLYMVPVTLENHRGQVVIIDPELIRVSGEKPFRAVSSFVYSVKGSIPSGVKKQIDDLIASDSAWLLTKESGENTLQYVGIADEDITAEDLREIIIEIAVEADAVEKQLTGKDEF